METQFDFTSAAPPLLPIDRAHVFFDGTFTSPKLSHPEGVSIGPQGDIWAGNQDGDVFRILPNGNDFQIAARTGGFALGLAFEGDRALFICDLRHKAVFRLELTTGELSPWRAEGLKIPNFPLVDRRRNRLFVSDSHGSGTPGPGIWTFNLATGEGSLWFAGDLNFANGLAMRPDEDAIFVCETFAPAITRIGILPDGSAGERRTFVANLPGLPDGIAFDQTGTLFVGCYEPSRILRISPHGKRIDVLIEDITAHTLCHPTNIAFDGKRLITANLGRWHLTEISVEQGARPLWESTA